MMMTPLNQSSRVRDKICIEDRTAVLWSSHHLYTLGRTNFAHLGAKKIQRQALMASAGHIFVQSGPQPNSYVLRLQYINFQ